MEIVVASPAPAEKPQPAAAAVAVEPEETKVEAPKPVPAATAPPKKAPIVPEEIDEDEMYGEATTFAAVQ